MGELHPTFKALKVAVQAWIKSQMLALQCSSVYWKRLFSEIPCPCSLLDLTLHYLSFIPMLCHYSPYSLSLTFYVLLLNSYKLIIAIPLWLLLWLQVIDFHNLQSFRFWLIFGCYGDFCKVTMHVGCQKCWLWQSGGERVNSQKIAEYLCYHLVYQWLVWCIQGLRYAVSKWNMLPEHDPVLNTPEKFFSHTHLWHC